MVFKSTYLNFFIIPLFFTITKNLFAENKSNIHELFQKKYIKIIETSLTQLDTENQLKELITEIDIVLNISQHSGLKSLLCYLMSFILTGYYGLEFAKNSLLYVIGDLIFTTIPFPPNKWTYENFKDEKSELYNYLNTHTQKTENLLSSLSESNAIEYRIIRENITKEDFEKIINIMRIEETYRQKQILKDFSLKILGYGTATILGIISILKTSQWLKEDKEQQAQLYNLKQEIQKKLDSLSVSQI